MDGILLLPWLSVFPIASLIKGARDRQHGWKLGKPGSSKDRKQLETPCPLALHLSAQCAM